MTLTFKDLNLSSETLTALEAKGFVTPTPIQAETIPRLLSGCHDIIGQARTGTGKTAAFGLPLIEKIDFESPKVQALVLAPTRELAQQVAVEIQSLSHGKNLKVACVYGGQNIEPQIKAIKNGAQIVVGTPGRVIDHLNRKTIRPEEIKMVVLDEADEMLAMGFIEDLEIILEYVPEERQMLMFSATMPKRIQKLAEQFMKGYELVKAADLQENTVSLVTQIAHVVSGKQRPAALKRIIDATDKFYGVVFCRTRAEVDEVGARLAEEGNRAEVIHGDVSQPQREKIISNFKRRKTHVLVATDVAARGLDISGLSHVVNYSLPQNPEIYVHRIGRTGRAGNEGTAITLITSREKRRLSEYERATSGRITIEPMPSGEAIIRRHEEKIVENVKSIIESGKHQKFSNFAQSLLELGEANDIIAALMKYSFADRLDIDKFEDLNEAPSRSERGERGERSANGSKRLFVFKGEKDRMTARSLVHLFTDALPINARDIEDVTVFETFSFITVSPENAELILGEFGSKEGQRGIVEVAADKNHPSKRRTHSDAGSARRDRSRGDRSERSYDRPRGDRPERSYDRPRGDRPERSSDRPRGDRSERSYDRPRGDRPERSYDRPRGERSERSYDRPRGERSERSSDRPSGERSERSYDRPRGERSERSSDRPRGERSGRRGEGPYSGARRGGAR